MITDTVYLAITALRYCQAAGRSIISRGLGTGAAGLMSHNWIGWRRQPRRRKVP